MESLAMIIAALCLDRLLGEPSRWHPLVGFGRLASLLESRFNRGGRRRRLLAGALAWTLLVAVPALIVLWVSHLLSPPLHWLFATIILWLCVGRRSLHEHTRPIAAALAGGDVDEARRRTAWIVSRDVEGMDGDRLCRSAIESILENGNDAVIAPLFWFLVAGPAGAVAHRAINTLDAMWGYRNDRFDAFGKTAARADDVAAFLPARLTASGYALGGRTALALTCWRQQARLLTSPNGGPCMTAGGGALDVRLGGDCRYGGVLHHKPEFGGQASCTPHDIGRALDLLDSTLWLGCMTLVAGFLLGSLLP